MGRGRTPGSGERRSRRRYRVALAVRWKLLLGKRVLESGAGMTVNLSSGGLLFETDRELRPGLGIEVSIAWPVLLCHVSRLQLVVAGEVVRTTRQRVAIRFSHHEFRTVAAWRAAGSVRGYTWSALNDAPEEPGPAIMTSPAAR